MKYWQFLLIISLLSMTTLSLAKPKPPAHIRYRVKVSGISGAPLDNVKAYLHISKKSYGRLSHYQAKQLYKEDGAVIKKALQPYGYFRATVISHLKRDGNVYQVWFVVNPGKAMRINQLNIGIVGEGARNPALLKAIENNPLKQGMQLNVPTYQSSKTQLIRIAKEQGYLFARFSKDTTDINLTTYQATMNLQLNTGKRYYFGDFSFANKTPLDESFLRRFIFMKPGQPFDERLLNRLQSDYSQAGYFRNVEVVPQSEKAQQDKSNIIPVTIHMHMNKKHLYQVGGGYGTASGPRLRLMTQGRWVGTQGDRYTASTIISRRYYQLSGQYIIPGSNPAYDYYSLNADVFLMEPKSGGEAFVNRFGPGYTWQNSNWIINSFLYFYKERWKLNDNDPYTNSHLIQPYLNMVYTNRKNIILVENGYKLSVTVAGSVKALYSSLTYVQPQVQFKWIKTIGENNRLTFFTQLGSTLSKEKDKLPLSQRFYAGGQSSMLGFDFQGIGPGYNVAVANIDWQRRVTGMFYAGPFLNIGNAYNGKFSNYRDNLQRSAGLSVVWRSPVGDIRVYWAKAISLPGSPNRFGITLGPEL